ncbi:acetoacetate decarboxylase family protein [Chloroflexota bacterium]
MREDQEGFSMPLGAPAYVGPPYWARPEGKLLLAFFYTDTKALEYEVPEPLELASDPICLAWMSDLSQPPHTFEFYHECLTAIRVNFRDITGWYINYIWSSNDQAVLLSREVYGWPAQLCENERLRYDGSQILAECNRNGVRLMRMVFNVTSPPPTKREEPLEDEFFKLLAGDFLQPRKIPSPEKDGKPLKHLIRIPAEDFKCHELWKGEATLELGKSGYHPNLHRINPTQIVAAYFLRSEWVVPYCKIIWKSSQL